MVELLQPLQASSLKEVFIERFEELILSGKVSVGERLPSERALALRLGVSRPVVHEGLLELAGLGLLTMKPRVGTVVNDYRREGSLALFGSLIRYGKGRLEPRLRDGLLELRRVVESETARLAARNRGDEDLQGLREILAGEREAEAVDLDRIVDLDFRFHHGLALASGNAVYPMLIKSFEAAQKNLATEFFASSQSFAVVRKLHHEIVEAVALHDERRAAAVMGELLEHGRRLITQGTAAQADQRGGQR